MINIKSILILLLITLTSSLQAQSFIQKGQIVGRDGAEIPGVQILLKGTKRAVMSDVDGRFSINIPDSIKNPVLIISFIGMKETKYSVKRTESDIVKITLEDDVTLLDEVMVVGYVSKKSKSLTGSVTTVKESKSKKSRDKAKPTDTEIRSGTLTAGEINDFSKWNQWDKILNETFNTYRNKFKINPTERYVSQLTDQRGTPLVDANVQLIDTKGDVIWQSRTDNTGKAELWANILWTEKGTQDDGKESIVSVENTTVPSSIRIQYQGQEVEITDIKPFSEKETINTVKIDADCYVPKTVDLFFAVDATGSMADEMKYLQLELLDIINTLKKQKSQLEFRLGSLVYRDKGDEYLIRKSSLNSDPNITINFLKEQVASGGGDYPEALDEALYQAIELEDWNQDALARIAFLVLDAPSHHDEVSVNRIHTQMKLAAERGIRLIPIACSDIQKDAEYLMRSLALATNGTYVFLTDDSGVGNAHIKPTTDKYDVEKLNEAIIRIVNQYTKMPDCTNDSWAKEDKKEDYDTRFIPNPSDENPENDVSKMQSKNVFEVYPNPCSDVLKIKLKKEVSEIYVQDLTGKSLMHLLPNKSDYIEADVSSLSAGTYLVRAFYKGRWFTYKVIMKGGW